MTNYEDIYMKKGNSIINLRIIFTEDSTCDKEYEWNGNIFWNEKNVDFTDRYNRLKEAGYKEACMCKNYYGDIHFEEV